jgi:hypothetical protein
MVMLYYEVAIGHKPIPTVSAAAPTSPAMPIPHTYEYIRLSL